MGQHEFQTDDDGAGMLALAGDFGLTEAAFLKAVLQDALVRAPSRLTLDLSNIGKADLPFFQLLFALASQARAEKRRVGLRHPLPEALLRAAGALGISLMDFEQTFDLE